MTTRVIFNVTVRVIVDGPAPIDHETISKAVTRHANRHSDGRWPLHAELLHASAERLVLRAVPGGRTSDGADFSLNVVHRADTPTTWVTVCGDDPISVTVTPAITCIGCGAEPPELDDQSRCEVCARYERAARIDREGDNRG